MKRTAPYRMSGVAMSDIGTGSVERHADLRLEAVTQILILVYYLRRFHILPKSLAVSASAARLQALSGSKAHKTQAAHHVPAHILVGDRALEKWLPGDADELRAMLRHHVNYVFAGTEVLPDWVNKADSLWEAKGLVDAVVEAVKVVENGEWSGRGEDAATNLAGAFEVFRRWARQALASAKGHNELQLKTERDSVTREMLRNRKRVLEVYNRCLGVFRARETIDANLSKAMEKSYAESLGKG